MKAEYLGNKSFLRTDSVEHEGYAEAQSIDLREGKERGGASGLFEAILDRDNLNRAYKQVRKNHGAPGIDGMTVEEALPWIKEHRDELLQSLRDESYEPSPVRRKEIPKPDGGVRKLGIPTVIDRIIQQAIAQKLQSIWEPLLSRSSFAYRPNRSAQTAIRTVKEYAKKGYTYAVSVDLSKYFDTLNHNLLMDMLHAQIQDGRVLRLIKKYLKSGVMEDGIVTKTEEGTPQGGPLSPLLANIYLNEFDWEMSRRGVMTVRYADDIVVLARSKRAANRLLGSCRRYLEGKLKLKMNTEKSKVTDIYDRENFKFLGFCLSRSKDKIFICVHRKSLEKAKKKLTLLTKRNRGRNVREVMKEVKVYIRGWLGYYHIANIKRKLQDWNGWLRRRIRMYIWKQWKNPKTRITKLIELGIPTDEAHQWGYTRKGYWCIAGSQVLSCSITNDRLAADGYFDIVDCYESLHSNG